MKHVHIESDGTPAGTKITVDGQAIEVTGVVWEMGVRGIATVRIECPAATLDVMGDLTEVTVNGGT